MSKQHYEVSSYRAQESVGYLVKRSHSLMHDLVEPLLEAHGFSFIQYVMLAWLRDGIAINPKTFCALYRHDTGAVTRVIDQLAERGLLVRVRRDCGDRRKVELELTRAGREAVEQMIPIVVDKLNLALAEFSEAEFEELRRLLIKLNTTMQTAVESAGTPAEA
jgi:DNA-binding MarR family transcriptional regulator